MRAHPHRDGLWFREGGSYKCKRCSGRVKLGYDDKLRLLGESETLSSAQPEPGGMALSDRTLDAPATIRDVAFATALATVTSIRVSDVGDSRGALDSVVESVEIAATSAAAEVGANAVLTAIAQYVVILSAL